MMDDTDEVRQREFLYDLESLAYTQTYYSILVQGFRVNWFFHWSKNNNDVEFYMKHGLSQNEAIEYIMNKLKVKQLWSIMSKKH